MAASAKKKAAPKGGKRAAKPTKDETVDVSNGLSLLIGDNGPPNKDLLYHMDQIAGYMDKAKTANGRVSAAKKAAKEANVNVKAIMDTLSDLRLDPLELAQRLRQKAALYREKGMPIQLKLYETKFADVDDQARAEGNHDGENGKPFNISRWPEDAPGHVAYSRAWNDSQAVLVAQMGKSKDED